MANYDRSSSSPSPSSPTIITITITIIIILMLLYILREVRPVYNASSAVFIKVGITLTQIFDMVSHHHHQRGQFPFQQPKYPLFWKLLPLFSSDFWPALILSLNIFFCDTIFVFFSVNRDLQAKLDQWWLITGGEKTKSENGWNSCRLREGFAPQTGRILGKVSKEIVFSSEDTSGFAFLKMCSLMQFWSGERGTGANAIISFTRNVKFWQTSELTQRN